MMIIEFQIEVISLEIHQTEDTRDGAGDFAEAVVDSLSLQCDALLEFFAMHLQAATYL